MSRFSLLSFGVGIALSVLALYLAFYHVPFSDLFSYLAKVRYEWTLLAAALVMVCFVLRALRWRLILGQKPALGFWAVYHPVMIGFMVNCILPGRVGEAVRPFLIHQREDIPFSFGLATVAAERLFDLVMLFLLLALTWGRIHMDPGHQVMFGQYRLSGGVLETVGTGMARLGLVLAVAVALLVIRQTREVLVRLMIKAPALLFFLSASTKEKIREKICVPMAGMVENAAQGLSVVKRPKHLIQVAGLTALIWGVQAFSYYVMALGCPDIRLSLAELTAVMVVICFFIALPSVPGFWGLWEAGGVFALSLLAVPEDKAAGFALLSHVVQMFPVIAAGWISAVAIGLNMRRTLKLGRET